jgi:hypothetical protein
MNILFRSTCFLLLLTMAGFTGLVFYELLGIAFPGSV